MARYLHFYHQTNDKTNITMKKVTVTPTDLLIKALDIELKAILQKDLKAFRAKQAQSQKIAA